MFNPVATVNKRLLSLLQTGFPLVEEPFDVLGRQLNLSTDEVIRQIADLKNAGIIRQISPIMDARRLGYQSTLVPMKIPISCLEEASQAIRKHPGISHGYERNHELNIWVTLAIPGNSTIEIELKRLANETGALTIYDLPALKVFKLRAIFGEDADDATPPEAGLQNKEVFAVTEKLVINTIQQDIELGPAPFTKLADTAGMSTEDFLKVCRDMRQRGIIRRYGASINHRNAGFKANAMVGWTVSPALVESVGQLMAARREISHCYERKTNPEWRYNLFTMIHSQTKEGCQEVVRELSAENGLTDYVMLYSTREIKKTRIKYPVEEGLNFVLPCFSQFK